MTVRVLDVDIRRKRIALTMRSEDTDEAKEDAKASKGNRDKPSAKSREPRQPDVANNTFADALAGMKKNQGS